MKQIWDSSLSTLTHSSSREALSNIKYISEKELRTHNKRDDLWIAFEGKAYNVTNWVNHHPGGKLPLRYFAGQDVTDAFYAYHPKSASKYLDLYFTGYHLENYTPSKISQDYKKLHSDFVNMGIFEKKGHGMLIMMTITLMIFVASVYYVLASKKLWVHLVSGGMMGFSWIQCGWFMHDCGHYNTMINPRLNQIVLFFVSNCLTGITSYGWKRHHNAHHISTNSLEFDPDTHFMLVLFCSSEYFMSLTSNYYKRKLHFDDLFKLIMSCQDLLCVLYWTFGRGFGYVVSFFFLLLNEVPNKCLEISGLLVFWIWFPLLLSCLPNWVERVGFVVVALAVAGIQNFQFFLNHFSSDVYVGPPGGDDWIEKQIVGTLNIKCSPWMDWFHGGLQFQIEHHLFPRMPRCQLRKISPIVKEFCLKHDIPYNCATSFWEASLATINTIRGVALEARYSSNDISKN